MPKFTLNRNNFYSVLTPEGTNINYSRHSNFGDSSTLQYVPVIQDFIQYETQQGDPWAYDVGTVNGYQAIASINTYLIQFFDTFLKNIKSNTFSSCFPIPNTTLVCGPGTTNS